MHRYLDRGFGKISLMEIVVVVVVVAVAAAVLIPSVSWLRESGRRSSCAANLRLIGVGLHRYADRSDMRLPAFPKEFRGSWPWDAPAGVVDEIIRLSGGDQDTFYCPSGEKKNRAAMWDYATYPEGGDRVGGFRATSYVLLLEGAPRVESQHTNRFLSDPMIAWRGGAGGTWEEEIPASERELAVDAVVSEGGRPGRFHSIESGMEEPHRANHLRFRRPQGGNILFADGHVEWREFSEMDDYKVIFQPMFWW